MQNCFLYSMLQLHLEKTFDGYWGWIFKICSVSVCAYWIFSCIFFLSLDIVSSWNTEIYVFFLRYSLSFSFLNGCIFGDFSLSFSLLLSPDIISSLMCCKNPSFSGVTVYIMIQWRLKPHSENTRPFVAQRSGFCFKTGKVYEDFFFIGLLL